MQTRAHTMPHHVPHNAKTQRPNVLLDGMSNVTDAVPIYGCSDTTQEASRVASISALRPALTWPTAKLRAVSP